jgi:hypothetical protein
VVGKKNWLIIAEFRFFFAICFNKVPVLQFRDDEINTYKTGKTSVLPWFCGLQRTVKAWNMCEIFSLVPSKNLSPEKMETN